MPRAIANAVISVVLVVMLVDALPTINRFHGDLKDRVDPLVDVTGTWQGSWNLYSPSPDRVNERLLATVEYTDGSQAAWSSPDWRDRSALRRFLSFRELEYFDDVARGATPVLLARLADHIVGAVPEPPPGVDVARVTIEVGTSQIVDPRVDFQPLDAYLDPRETRVLHVETYR